MSAVYMDVHDLTKEQIEELKFRLYDELQNTDDADTFLCYDDIPDEVIFEHYAGIAFVNDDFWCTCEPF